MKIDKAIELRNEMMRSLSDDRVGTRWRHKKTGRLYTIIGSCRLEHDASPAYLYIDEDGVTWARNKDEFMDEHHDAD